MQRWKKGLFIGLFSSLLWEQQSVQAAIGLTAPKGEHPFAPEAGKQTGVVLPIVRSVSPPWAPEQEPEPMESVTNHRLLTAEQKLAEQAEEEQRQAETAERELVLQQNRPPQLASRGDLLEAPPRASQSAAPGSNAYARRSAPASNPAPQLIQQSGATSTQAGRLTRAAMQYRGAPYVYGGTDPSGFDCSGFIQYVYQQCGITLPRTTYQQAAAGVPVSRSALQPGDLVFFSCGGQATSHAGIYLGDGTFIHADQTHGIAVDELDGSYWSSVYQTGVRVR
jgi:cell wall-associated NlpC family hydrolase